jgi:hypothetical protein
MRGDRIVDLAIGNVKCGYDQRMSKMAIATTDKRIIHITNTL